MSRRATLLVLAVAALAALNLWRWAGGDGAPHARGAASAGAFSAADFSLRVGLATGEAPRSARNLFEPRLPPPPAPPAKPVPVQAEAPPPPPVKSARELAEEAARAEIGQIKLVGVVFRGEQGQAFLVKGEQVYLVQAGARVGDRFHVEAISPDSIQLRDPATQVSGRIPVSGK